MAVIMATFTDKRDAERAAAALTSSGFKGASVGTSSGDVGDLVGLGATETGFRNLVILGSTLGGAAGLGALGFLLGIFSMGITDIRGQGTVESIGPALSSLVLFAVGLAVVGAIGGLIGGFLNAQLAGSQVRNAVANGEAPRRPMLTVKVNNRQEEDAAHMILREVGPPFEVNVS
jgi:hypothetical protein